MKLQYLILCSGVIILPLGFGCTPPEQALTTNEIVATETTTPDVIVNNVIEPEPTTKIFHTSDISGLDANFNFSVEIPAQWEVENVAEIQSLNFYDPSAAGDTNLDKSQIFVRYFLAIEFLTLSTVMIHSNTELTINGHEAIAYDIEKKPAVANFTSQPKWRNLRHTVTDIRTSTNSLVFYVFGQRPGLEQTVLDQFFNSLSITG